MFNFTTPIPLNTDDGTELMGGAIKIRNLIEAIIAGVICYFICKFALAFLSDTIKSIATFLIVFLAAVFFLFGIKGLSITQYIARRIRFNRNKSIATMEMPTRKEG